MLKCNICRITHNKTFKILFVYFMILLPQNFQASKRCRQAKNIFTQDPRFSIQEGICQSRERWTTANVIYLKPCQILLLLKENKIILFVLLFDVSLHHSPVSTCPLAFRARKPAIAICSVILSYVILQTGFRGKCLVALVAGKLQLCNGSNFGERSFNKYFF